MSNTPPPPPPGFGGPPPPPNYGAPPPPPAFGMNYNDQSGVNYAEWWQRLVAIIIDGIILQVVLVPIRAIFGFGSSSSSSAGFGFSLGAGGILASIVLNVAYYGVLHALRGQTVGKMALGIKVVKKGTDQNLEMGPALIRALIPSVLWFTCIGGLLDGLWPLWDKEKQAIHDKAVGSYVVKAR